MSFLDLAKNRYTTKTYSDKKIDANKIEELKNYYGKYAVEKRFLFGVYGKSTFISDLKRYNLDFKILKNCMQEDEKELIENIRKIYFEIGIGDK